ncbi:MAG: AraC family transcriptional regulator [Myxococcales bacterium]|nr:AraC family transcriptional regulator [Myxococcales bacterium]
MTPPDNASSHSLKVVTYPQIFDQTKLIRLPSQTLLRPTKCYAVVSGECWLSVEGVEEPAHLKTGDSFVLPGGRPFRLASDMSVEATPAKIIFENNRRGGTVTHNGGGEVLLVGSRFALRGNHTELLLGLLPPIVHLRKESEQEALRWSVQRMMQELREQQPGSDLMAQHLAHMMLLQALRLHLSAEPPNKEGWLYALADKQIGAALHAIHDEPARRWTLPELATCANMSRSIFALRFKDLVGTSPIQYLTRWKMILAGDKLEHTKEPISSISYALGYESESAFSTAFKRVMGCSPRRYARSHPTPEDDALAAQRA